VSAVDVYLRELGAVLHVRGRARRRFLQECREHLAESALERGEHAAVDAFGSPVEIAAAFDAEVAGRRAVHATFATAVGVLATGASTLALIHAAAANATAPAGWAIAFFVAAQLAGVAAGLALVQALVLRRSVMPAAQSALLARRNGYALVAAAVTMFSAGAAMPGHGSPVLLLAGPALAGIALIAVLRARSLARKLDGAGALVVRSPLKDLGQLTRLPLAAIDIRAALAATTCLAAVAAFLRDRGEQASVSQAMFTAGIEGLAVVGCFVIFGPPLGLWRRERRH
jgi:uncharacterized membrane protein